MITPSNRITKVICRFVATEFDEEGNVLCELPVAASDETFNIPIYYPFGSKLDELVAKINEDINAKEAPESVQKGPAGVGVRGYECPPPVKKGRRKENRPQAQDE